MGPILAALSPSEREELFRFYNLKEKAAQVSQDLGMSENEFQDLKERMRKKFILSERLQ